MSADPKLATEAQRLEEDCLYNARANYEAALSWRKLHYALGIPATVLAVGSAVLTFSTFGLAVQVCSIGSALFVGLLTTLNPAAKAEPHYNAGSRFNALKASLRFFREIELAALSDDNARSILKRHLDEKNRLTSDSPPIPKGAYQVARAAIERGESRYEVDS